MINIDWYTNTLTWEPAPSELTLARVLDLMQRFREDFELTIYVWDGTGNESGIISPLGKRPTPNPILIKSNLIEKGQIYILAGVGVVAGLGAYNYLDEHDYVLKWTSNKPESKLQAGRKE